MTALTPILVSSNEFFDLGKPINDPTKGEEGKKKLASGFRNNLSELSAQRIAAICELDDLEEIFVIEKYVHDC